MSLHLSGSGGVAIILEAGSGGDHRSWSLVQPLLNRLGRVVSYDRLDYGASGRSRRPRSAAIVAEQLREGLERAGVRPPYLLVGHSYGGALVRVFASKYPNDVIGIVLVDPAMENFYTRATIEEPRAYLAGLVDALLHDDNNAGEALRREYLAYETSMVQTRLSTPPPPRTSVLISALRQLEDSPRLNRLWLEEQTKWAQRVGARHLTLDAGHNLPRLRPQEIADAVASLLPPH
jgi:pimeloyl-ACP methyl ester carboxylesterase